MPKKKTTKPTEPTAIEAPVATHTARFYKYDSGQHHRTGDGYMLTQSKEGTLEQLTDAAIAWIRKMGLLWYTVHITPLIPNTGYNSFMRKVFLDGKTTEILTQDIVAAVVTTQPLELEKPEPEAVPA